MLRSLCGLAKSLARNGCNRLNLGVFNMVESARAQRLLQAHSGCWPNPGHCGCRTDLSIGLLLLPRDCPGPQGHLKI